MRLLKLKKLKRVHGIHFAPDSKRLLAVGGEEVRMVDSAVWLDLATGESAGRINQFANCYAVDPQLTRYVLGGATQGRGWGGIAPVQWIALDPTGEWAWQKVDVPPGVINGLAFDPSGELLAVSHSRRSRPDKLSLLRIKNSSVVVSFQTTGPAGVIVFNPDVTRIALSGGIDGDPAVEWYTMAGGYSSPFVPPGTVTRALAYLPDDRLVVANGRNVHVLPAGYGEPYAELAGHPKQVNAVTLTPDGKRILTASHDGSIRAWNADTGEPGPQFDWDIGPVTALAFAPDGLTCAAAGLNGKIVLWDVDE